MARVSFPKFTGLRCLMMPYIQGEPRSVPSQYAPYGNIIRDVAIKRGDIGYLTIDESLATKGKPHRGARAKHGRALHTEAGRHPDRTYQWGGGWGGAHRVTLDGDVQILIASNMGDSCAVWNADHVDTSIDGDIGHLSDQYPYPDATILKAGEVRQIGIFTPHESLSVTRTVRRQFLRIVSSGVHGVEPYFTNNPMVLLSK